MKIILLLVLAMRIVLPRMEEAQKIMQLTGQTSALKSI